AWAMLYGASLMLALSLIRGQELAIEVSWQYIGGGLWLAVFGSVLAFSAYLTLLGRIGASRAAYATVLFPPIALGISTLVEGYQWSWSALIGLPLVLVGIVLINQTRRPAAPPPLPPAGSSPPPSPSSPPSLPSPASPRSPPEGSNAPKAKTP
ncbi:MAG: DMT family transporter, partial [Pseudomonadota bacterium]|nr:DMT family transporter [Pseudomonadota bacterium]